MTGKFLKALWRRLRHKLQICVRAPDYTYYINGPETLPPPLSKEQEALVFAGLERGDANSRELLIVHNLRLVVYIAKKFESKTAGVEDLISIGTIGLIKAVNTFVPSKKIKLATYASRCIENEILMYLRKSSNRRQESSIDEPLNTDGDGNELLLSDVLGTDQNQWAHSLSRMRKKTCCLRLWQGFPRVKNRLWSCASACAASRSIPRKKWPI